MRELDYEATLAIFRRRDIQPCRIRLHADPPCGLTAEFEPASQGRIRASITGIPAGTLVRSEVLVAFHGEDLGCLAIGKVVSEIGLELNGEDLEWSVPALPRSH